jgi:hypothetical protein
MNWLSDTKQTQTNTLHISPVAIISTLLPPYTPLFSRVRISNLPLLRSRTVF